MGLDEYFIHSDLALDSDFAVDFGLALDLDLDLDSHRRIGMSVALAVAAAAAAALVPSYPNDLTKVR